MKVVFTWKQIPELVALTPAQRKPVLRAWSAYYLKRHPIETAFFWLIILGAIVGLDDWFDRLPAVSLATRVGVTAAIVVPTFIAMQAINRSRLASRVHRFIQYKDYR